MRAYMSLFWECGWRSPSSVLTLSANSERVTEPCMQMYKADMVRHPCALRPAPLWRVLMYALQLQPCGALLPRRHSLLFPVMICLLV